MLAKKSNFRATLDDSCSLNNLPKAVVVVCVVFLSRRAQDGPVVVEMDSTIRIGLEEHG